MTVAFLPATPLRHLSSHTRLRLQPRRQFTARWGNNSDWYDGADWPHAWDSSRRAKDGWSRTDPRWRDPTSRSNRNWSTRGARADQGYDSHAQHTHPAVWERICDCDVVSCLDADPEAILFFVGSVGGAAAPRTMYSLFLEQIAKRGRVAIVAARMGEMDDISHSALYVAERCASAMEELRKRWGKLPVFGAGHGVGAKVLLMSGCRDETRELLGDVEGNMFIAYTGLSAREMIPALEWIGVGTAGDLEKVGHMIDGMKLGAVDGTGVGDALRVLGAMAKFVAQGSRGVDVVPEEEKMMELAGESYGIENNLVVSFDRDGMDGSGQLVETIEERFGGCIVRKVDGVHITPVTAVLDGKGEVESRHDVEGVVTVMVAFIRLRLECKV